MKKNERLELIHKIVLENEIETQHELVEILEGYGLKATQATISRDINHIGIIKVPGSSGRYVYGLSKESARKFLTPLQQACESINSVSDKVEGLELMLNVMATPGTTRRLKRLILEELGEFIFSILADDDSLLIIFKDIAQADEVRSNLKAWSNIK